MKKHSVFIAGQPNGDRLLVCEVIKQTKKRLHCLVINGAWNIKFDLRTRTDVTGDHIDRHVKAGTIKILCTGKLPKGDYNEKLRWYRTKILKIDEVCLVEGA